MLLSELYNKACGILFENDVPDYKTDAKYLMEYCIGLKPLELTLNPNRNVSDKEAEMYLDLIKKRAGRYPLQYITNSQIFMGLDYYVDESVLIPRQDTEILVEQVLQRSNGKSVLDMCTGSGCIIISLKVLGNLSKAVGVDISDKALSIARKNSEKNNTDVTFVQSDLFENVTGKYDIIVSNPPYIPDDVVNTLMPEVRCHEPVLALRADNRGLEYYMKISKEAKSYLNPGGMIAYEIGCEQAKDVSEILENEGYTDIRVVKDYASLDRVVLAVLN